MAEKGVILSAEEEEKLLKPIDEYVGKYKVRLTNYAQMVLIKSEV